MKLMTFEEWWGDKRPDINSGEYSYAEVAWAKARIGMIPEDEAIRIPDWPGDAIELMWQWNYGGTVGPVNTITRPKPAWVPKVGEPVFLYDNPAQDILVVRIEKVFDNIKMAAIATVHGAIGDRYLENLKPFNPAYIGKLWSEIPGNPE